MSKKEGPVLKPNWLFYSSLLTGFMFVAPITIYSSDRLFTRFCSFHKRVLKLEGKSARSLFGTSLLVSLVYSTISLHLYYYGMLHIVGINSFFDLEGYMTNQFIKEDEDEEDE